MACCGEPVGLPVSCDLERMVHAENANVKRNHVAAGAKHSAIQKNL
jgi:hypothetical protein